MTTITYHSGTFLDEEDIIVKNGYEGTWSSSTTYHIGDMVEYNGDYYLCIFDDNGSGITNIMPTNTTYWVITTMGNAEITISGQIFSMAGYEIKEWNTAIDGTGTTYASESGYLGPDLELYAIWQLSNAGALLITNVVNNQVQQLDISNALQGITAYFGKNQPFAYIVLEVLKSPFMQGSGYWEDRLAHDLNVLNPDYSNYTYPPPLDQVGTVFTTDVYSIKGTWLYERVEDGGEFSYKIVCVCPAYFLKKTTLATVFNFSRNSTAQSQSKYTFFNIPQLYSKYEEYDVSPNMDRISFSYNGTLRIRVYVRHEDTAYIDRIEADGGELFRLLSIVVGGYSWSNVVLDDGYMPFTGNDPSDFVINSKYTKSEIEALKQNKYPLSGYGKYHADTVTLRPDEFCWDVIDSLGTLSNRTPFFYDKAYFVDYDSGSQNVQLVSKFKLNWGGDDSTDTDGYFNPEFNSISTNQDQGSEYVLSSQKVISEGYEYEIKISDAPTTNSGKDIKFLARENASSSSGAYVFDTTTRNFQTQLIALNTLMRWYKPQDAVMYSIQETIRPDRVVYTYPTSSLSANFNGEIISYLDDDRLVDIYFKGLIDDISGTTTWSRVTDFEMRRDRQGGFSPYALCSEIFDVQNNIKLYNVPLAQTVLTYPEMITEYTWGEPYFIDEENALSSLETVARNTTLDNTADMTISNNYAAKLVVGNQKLSEVQDDRAGFRGLIMEKNWDAELYRLAGYGPNANGDTVLQSYISSDGKVMAGNGSVMIYSGGIVTGYGGSQTKVITNTSNVTYDSNKTYKIGDIYFDPSVGKLKIYMG